MLFILQHVDNVLRNITPTILKPLTTLTAEQTLRKLEILQKLEERYPEKEADQKMKGI